ncbi:hypothetical protein SO802_033800 [Lithocarpus litseifolius]|uniref:DUF4283 domain-containing protein n=1 Tax=Lithocarpus litseifolius TaxID=425828 RepID=A0AAW2BE23_9ROSI
MDDDVADRMEKMKLTIEEEEIIPISYEGRLDAIESLMGKFLTCKPFNRMAAKNTIRRAWGLNDSLQISEMGSNLFQFKFQSEFDMDRIMRRGPWSFDNQLLLLKRWKKGMTVGNIQMDSASFWVQIWDAPFDMISSQVAREVGSRLGTVEEVERRYRKDDINMFIRVCMALPIAKPLLRGHDLKNCAAHFAAEKQGRRIECQYGDFLKATGSRPRATTTKSAFSMPHTEDGNGSTVKQNSGKAVQGEVQVQSAARENSMENPSNMDKGCSVNQGMGAKIVHGNNVNIECNANVQELIAKTGELNADMGLFPVESSEHVVFDSNTLLDKDGPSKFKPIGTWTRINSIEFGLGGFTKAITIPSLGKRNSREMQEG